MEKKISRQRRWQLKKRKEGKCVICGKVFTNGQYTCDSCAKKIHGVQKRRPTLKQWQEVDWNLSNKEIAENMNVRYVTVYNQRRKHIENNKLKGKLNNGA